MQPLSHFPAHLSLCHIPPSHHHQHFSHFPACLCHTRPCYTSLPSLPLPVHICHCHTCLPVIPPCLGRSYLPLPSLLITVLHTLMKAPHPHFATSYTHSIYFPSKPTHPYHATFPLLPSPTHPPISTQAPTSYHSLPLHIHPHTDTLTSWVP